MLKKLCIFTFLFFTISVSYAQSWIPLPDFPGTERDDACLFVIGNKAYCGSGFLPWFAPSNDFYALNFDGETWSPIASMPAGSERQYACGFSDGHYGYVFGGLTGTTYLNDLYRYDTLTNSWDTLASLPDTGRAGSSCFVINDTAYIVGGKNSVIAATNEVWAYAILTNTWTQKSNLPNNGRWRAGATSVNGKGYLVSGRDKNGYFCHQLYQYNPSADAWTHISNFGGNGRNYIGFTALYNNLYLVAGIDSLNTYYNDFYTYDVSANTWGTLTPIPSAARKGGLCFSSQNSIYYTTGINASNTRLKETWRIYNPTGIHEQNAEISITLYPNPASTNLTISTPFHQFHVKIFASTGQTVYSFGNTGHSTSIDVSSLKTGLYNIYISDGKNTITKKLIINPQNE
ncbi:MAG TPA: kelch repeat-containing protein [Flavobacteriales bacterium]|nr:kelch repeat-containing protein [Flavobacteriales bacterium]